MADLTSNTVSLPSSGVTKKKMANKAIKKPQPKPTISYDTGNEVSSNELVIASRGADSKDYIFYSNIKSLRLKLLTPVDDESYEETTVVFNNERFVSSDSTIVELLKAHPNYGGSSVKKFEDRIYGSREPLFWEGAYPEDVRKMREQQNNQLVQEPGIYEKGADS